MFPLQDNLLLQEPSILEQDLVEIGDVLTGSTRKRQRTSKLGVQENKEDPHTLLSVKKIMHRETERQRRQEMAGLYASLRSLLPLEYIKGKRSVSDHMHQAVSYIKHMETNIKELRLERDKLKKITKMSNCDGFQSCRSNSNTAHNSLTCVTVNSCRDGIEVLITCGIDEKLWFPISKVLMELLNAGITIMSCVSSKSRDRFIYRIQSDVCDLTYVNVSELQQRLTNVIKFSG